ncbi:CotY/CotZ family spore coat protein [Lederbergia panacisoli]|uniref:CotY/CotZ family spore coat protein n=1 Tax=Lederbergia panacisoli TaxID=1255251 RepID=UPI00214B5CF7|nr:CotY/CotZ family spore coat protein [Lederbergia panacisoli]MCR2821965.1 CotY/CotZ family spore coat protein [Lederbergia panacisoli]
MPSQNEKHTIYNALVELKGLQDLLTESSSKYFGSKLADLVGVDTIPFIMYTHNGLLHRIGRDAIYNNETFVTNYFRIESIDDESGRANISLLRPFDIHGKNTLSIDELIVLKKTSSSTIIDLSQINGIQPLDTDYIKRKIIIEQKW